MSMEPYYFKVNILRTMSAFPRWNVMKRWNWDYVSSIDNGAYLAVMPPHAKMLLDPGPFDLPHPKKPEQPQGLAVHRNTGSYQRPNWTLAQFVDQYIDSINAQRPVFPCTIWQYYEEVQIRAEKVSPHDQIKRTVPLDKAMKCRLSKGFVLVCQRATIQYTEVSHIHDETIYDGEVRHLDPIWYVRADDLVMMLGGDAPREAHPYQDPRILADWLQDRDQYQDQAEFLRFLIQSTTTKEQVNDPWYPK